MKEWIWQKCLKSYYTLIPKIHNLIKYVKKHFLAWVNGNLFRPDDNIYYEHGQLKIKFFNYSPNDYYLLYFYKYSHNFILDSVCFKPTLQEAVLTEVL